MKWTKRGHQLDELGAVYTQVKKMYIWGAGKNGYDCIKFLSWLTIENDFEIAFVDVVFEKRQVKFENHSVISPQQLFEELSTDFQRSILVITPNNQFSQIIDMFPRYIDTNKNIFVWQQVSHRQKNEFIRHFLCVYLLYKYDKLLSHWTDCTVTTYCNLNCLSCLKCSEYIKNPEHFTFENLKENIDTIFTKFDFLYSLHFTGGETLLYSDLPRLLEYVHERYGERIYDSFVITNSTLIPSAEMLRVMKKYDIWLNIDDYSFASKLSAERLPQIINILDENSVRYSVLKVGYWYDIGFNEVDNSSLTEDEMIEWRNDCQTFLQSFADKKIYSCCYADYAVVAGEINDTEHIAIESSSKTEILEFRWGYTEKGYVDFCRRCRGIGKNTYYIAPAKQVIKR